MKHIFLPFLLIFSIYSSSQGLYKESLDKIPERTETYKVSDSVSLHFVVMRKSKPRRYEYQPFLVGKKVKKLKPFSFYKKIPQYISAHVVGNKWVCIYKQSHKYFVIDYDFSTEKMSTIKTLDDFKHSFNIINDNVSLFYSKKQDTISLTKIIDSKHIKHLKIEPKTIDDKAKLKYFKFNSRFNYGFDFINNIEYIDVGSIKKGQIFTVNNHLVYSYDNVKNHATFLMFIDEKEQKYEIHTFKNDLEKNNSLRSFVLNDLLFQFSINRKTGRLIIFDIANKAVLKSFTYTKKKFGPYNKYYYDDEEVPLNSKKFFKSFKTLIASYDPTIFITVNQAVNNSYIIECGHINGATYNYNSIYYRNLFWFNNNLWKPKPIKPHIPLMGPHVTELELGNIVKENLLKTSFVLALDASFNPLKSIPQPLFKKDKWKKENKKIAYLKENTLRHFSKVELKDKIRFTYYDNNFKNIIINEIIQE